MTWAMWVSCWGAEGGGEIHLGQAGVDDGGGDLAGRFCPACCQRQQAASGPGLQAVEPVRQPVTGRVAGLLAAEGLVPLQGARVIVQGGEQRAVAEEVAEGGVGAGFEEGQGGVQALVGGGAGRGASEKMHQFSGVIPGH
jgi:hypothetical protein